MREVRKTIRRHSEDSANIAMNKHIVKMSRKGWILQRVFAGDHFLQYEIICYFVKE